MPPKKKKVPKRIPTMEDSPRENTKRATKALRPLQPVDPVDPDELPSRLLAKIISMSIRLIMISNSLILSSAIFITSLLKIRKFMKPSHQNESIYIKTYTTV